MALNCFRKAYDRLKHGVEDEDYNEKEQERWLERLGATEDLEDIGTPPEERYEDRDIGPIAWQTREINTEPDDERDHDHIPFHEPLSQQDERYPTARTSIDGDITLVRPQGPAIQQMTRDRSSSIEPRYDQGTRRSAMMNNQDQFRREYMSSFEGGEVNDDTMSIMPPTIEEGELRIQHRRKVIEDPAKQVFTQHDSWCVDQNEFRSYEDAVRYVRNNPPTTALERAEEVFHEIRENVERLIYRASSNASEYEIINHVNGYLDHKKEDGVIDAFRFDRAADTWGVKLSLRKGDRSIFWNIDLDQIMNRQ